MKEIILSEYQQKLYDDASQSNLKKKICGVISAAVVMTFAYGFFQQSKDTLPSYLTGWIVFAAIAYVVWNYFMAICGSLIWLILYATDQLFQQKTMAIENHNKTKHFFMAFLAKCKLVSPYNNKILAILDISADWLLFASLVTANHPIIALAFAVVLGWQYRLINSIAYRVKKVLIYIEDPLASASKESIDELMDKLCHDTCPDSDAPKE